MFNILSFLFESPQHEEFYGNLSTEQLVRAFFEKVDPQSRQQLLLILADFLRDVETPEELLKYPQASGDIANAMKWYGDYLTAAQSSSFGVSPVTFARQIKFRQKTLLGVYKKIWRAMVDIYGPNETFETIDRFEQLADEFTVVDDWLFDAMMKYDASDVAKAFKEFYNLISSQHVNSNEFMKYMTETTKSFPKGSPEKVLKAVKNYIKKTPVADEHTIKIPTDNDNLSLKVNVGKAHNDRGERDVVLYDGINKLMEMTISADKKPVKFVINSISGMLFDKYRRKDVDTVFENIPEEAFDFMKNTMGIKF